MTPSAARACACGCGIYEVGTAAMFPDGSGAMAFLDYDYQDQDHNWSGSSEAPAADNGDKDIRTSWFTLGYQDMFNRAWGIRLELPYERRYFETTGGATGNDIVALNFSGIGDIRIQGIYTGFSPDLAPHSRSPFERRGFRRFNVATDYGWSGFLQGLLAIPVLTQVQYRPGTEFDAALGIYYNGWSIGRVLISPIAQAKISLRESDTGNNASYPVASGFERVLLSPGIELSMHPVRVYTDIELPVYQHFTGDQLAAPVLFRLEIACMF